MSYMRYLWLSFWFYKTASTISLNYIKASRVYNLYICTLTTCDIIKLDVFTYHFHLLKHYIKIKNYPPTQSKFQVSYNDIIPKDEIEYIRDLRIAYVLGCYSLTHIQTFPKILFSVFLCSLSLPFFSLFFLLLPFWRSGIARRRTYHFTLGDKALESTKGPFNPQGRENNWGKTSF